MCIRDSPFLQAGVADQTRRGEPKSKPVSQAGESRHHELQQQLVLHTPAAHPQLRARAADPIFPCIAARQFLVGRTRSLLTEPMHLRYALSSLARERWSETETFLNVFF